MRKYEFAVALSAEQVHSVYEGKTRSVLVITQEGLKLQLPALNFRRFVTPEGIHGRFSITLDSNNKIQSLNQLA